MIGFDNYVEMARMMRSIKGKMIATIYKVSTEAANELIITDAMAKQLFGEVIDRAAKAEKMRQVVAIASMTEDRLADFYSNELKKFV